jgi:hypothetical protein
MRSMILAVASASACFAMIGAFACDTGATQHDYLAELYEPANACLEPSKVIDTIQTPEGSLLCAPTCLVQTLPGGSGENVYVSTMCGPYPSFVDTSQTDPNCPAAIAAYAAGCACGSPCPAADAGGDGSGDGAVTGDDGGGDDSVTSEGGDDTSGDDGSGNDSSDSSGDDGPSDAAADG